MKKLLLMAAFVAGPILYAQQKPISAKELQKDEVLQTEQRMTTKASQDARATKAKSRQVGETKAIKGKATKRDARASSLKNSLED